MLEFGLGWWIHMSEGDGDGYILGIVLGLRLRIVFGVGRG